MRVDAQHTLYILIDEEVVAFMARRDLFVLFVIICNLVTAAVAIFLLIRDTHQRLRIRLEKDPVNRNASVATQLQDELDTGSFERKTQLLVCSMISTNDHDEIAYNDDRELQALEAGSRHHISIGPRGDHHCAICLTEYVPGDKLAKSLNKGRKHEFHDDCILFWLDSRKNDMTCPCGRLRFIPAEVICSDGAEDLHEKEGEQVTSVASTGTTCSEVENDTSSTSSDNSTKEDAVEIPLGSVVEDATTAPCRRS
mmetsp:Transcript_27572/g.60409  ORF Transcript_27572/g.60409 Transcript_27572/m.60409 type:complete len:254 (+) Transcript_27572:213-974(+)